VSRTRVIRIVAGFLVVAGLAVSLWLGLADRAPEPDPAPERPVHPSEETEKDAAIENAIKDAQRGYREKIEKDWDDMFPKDFTPKSDHDLGDPDTYTRSKDDRFGEIYRIAKQESGDPDVQIGIDEGSRVVIVVDGERRPVTLEKLGTLLHRRRKLYEEEQRARGKKGYEEDRRGYASGLRVGLGVHPEVPWLHVRWVLSECAREFIDKVQLTVGRRSISMILPRTYNSTYKEPSPEIQATVAMLAVGDVKAKWGSIEVWLPAEVGYRVGGKGKRKVDGLDGVARYLAGAKRDALAARRVHLVTSTLKPSPRVPVLAIVDVLLLFVKSDIRTLDLVGFEIPTGQERNVKTLPYPDPKK